MSLQDVPENDPRHDGGRRQVRGQSVTRRTRRWLDGREFPFGIRFVDVGGHRLHYVDEGVGPTLLLVHAGPAWSFVYRDLIVRLRTQFRCVTLDFPGAGLSVAAAGYRPGMAAASQVLQAFVEALDLRDVTLVVHDVGGPVALGVAVHLPDRFVALVVTEAFGWPLSDENPKVARILRLVGSPTFTVVNGATNLLARVTATRYGIGRHLTAEGRRTFLGPYRDSRVRRYANAMLGDAAIDVDYLRALDNAVCTTLSDRPVLLVFGQESPTVKEGFPARWTARFPDARLILLEGAHHFPMMDDPDRVSAVIRSWWVEVVAAGLRTRSWPSG